MTVSLGPTFVCWHYRTALAAKALNSTKVGGISAILLAGLSAIVPVVETLSNSHIDVAIIIGMEALAAVLACVAARIYTVDARIRAELAKARLEMKRDQKRLADGRQSTPEKGSNADEMAKLYVLIREVINQTDGMLGGDKILKGRTG